ncbi:MAG: CoA pyrophosphatase [Bacteroidota bacterium]
MNLEKLKSLLITSLPGEEAHQKMAPLNRPISSYAKSMSDNYKESGVAVVIYKQAENHQIVLIQRPVYDGKHSGQVSFPGGKKEENDENLLQTAIRECFEEIGVSLNENQHIGKLTPVFIPVSNFHVEAHLFYLESMPEFKADEREVSEIFSIKLDHLLDDDFVKKMDMEIPNAIYLKEIPYFDLENKIIWGATALILNELKELLRLI